MSRTCCQWLIGLSILLFTGQLSGEATMKDAALLDRGERIINWIKSNVSAQTGLMLSFNISDEQKMAVYSQIGDSHSVASIIERIIVEEGLDVYDGAVGQIALTLSGEEDDLQCAALPIKIYWEGDLGQLSNIRAGFPINRFVYDVDNPEAVTSDLMQKGRRGFLFRIINAHGKYNTSDPLDGKTSHTGFPNWPTVHWEDWKPVAGENAWVVMAAMHMYHKKYYDPLSAGYYAPEDAVELLLAEEIARAALMLQADTGGIRMAPLGTYRNPADFTSPEQQQGTWWYTQISSENNVSWYAALRMLYRVTQKDVYKHAMGRIEEYFKAVWSDKEQYFYQGMHYHDGEWLVNDNDFALDVQTWAIAAFGPEMIDGWLGQGASYRLLNRAFALSGYYDADEQLLGVGYTEEHDRLSVEWTAGAISAAGLLAQYYKESHPRWSLEMAGKAQSMRAGIEWLRTDVSYDMTGYSYSSRRGWIPFGWNSHEPEVLSLASSGWVYFVDNLFNPFYLPQF